MALLQYSALTSCKFNASYHISMRNKCHNSAPWSCALSCTHRISREKYRLACSGRVTA